MKSSNIFYYKIVAFLSFLVLLGVQFFLVYNTYKLKEEHYYFKEKNLINDLYIKGIRNDKVFPGGQKIIDFYINKNMDTFEQLNNTNTAKFDLYKQKVCDSLFHVLRSSSTMDSLFKSILQHNQLKHILQYRLVVSGLSITFSGSRYIPLFQAGEKYPLIKQDVLSADGAIIDGTLLHTSEQNLVTKLNVSSASAHSYQISFALYVDTPYRGLEIFEQMIPTFALALFSILAVIMIYFFTFRNWLKQKKLAEMKSDFVNSITHEFQTPLATIIVANKNIQNAKIVEQSDNLKPLTSIIERQSQRLKTLFSSVLNITVMNKATLEKREYFLNDLLEEILLDYRLTLYNGNVEIEFKKEIHNYKISLDRFWFTTMLLNIFENAIKYNRRGTKKIEVEVFAEKKNIQIIISDNGIGMSPKTLNHIFEKFYRGNASDKDAVGGLGLGLFYTQQCLRAHDWKLEVQSEEGVGSKFIIFIPLT